MTVALGLGAAVAWAVVNLWLVTLSRRVDIAVTTLAVLASSTVVTLPLALAFEGAPGGDAWSHAPAAAAAGLLELAGFGCYIVAIRRGTLAVVAPLVGLEGGIAALVAIAGGEQVGATVVVGIVLAVVGTSLSCAERGERRASGAGWAILGGRRLRLDVRHVRSDRSARAVHRGDDRQVLRARRPRSDRAPARSRVASRAPTCGGSPPWEPSTPSRSARSSRPSTAARSASRRSAAPSSRR